MLWRTGLILAFIVGAAVLAYQIGSRLSDEAVTTIVGVFCGILASIPISIGLLIALTRDRSAVYDEDYDEIYNGPEPSAYPVYRAPPSPQPPQPQIIVVAPPQSQLAPSYGAFPNYLLPPPQDAAAPSMFERNFKIVGDDEGE